MKITSRDFLSTVVRVGKKIEEYVHKAVPAVSHTPSVKRYRLLGALLLPYHYLRPLPVRSVHHRR